MVFNKRSNVKSKIDEIKTLLRSHGPMHVSDIINDTDINMTNREVLWFIRKYMSNDIKDLGDGRFRLINRLKYQTTMTHPLCNIKSEGSHIKVEFQKVNSEIINCDEIIITIRKEK